MKEITFNATEFRNGLAFRFIKSENSRARIGNGRVSIPRQEAAKIRVADIVAASSCFPGGFEPLAFPDDFVWPDNQIPDAVRQAIDRDNGNSPIGLMDGGIYDNQGIDSLLLADKRNIEDLGLFIISDVDQDKRNLFPYPQSRQTKKRLTLGQVDWFIRVFLLTCSLTVISVGYDLWRKIQLGTFIFWQDFFSAVMPFLLAVLTTIALWWGRQLIRNELLPLVPQVGRAGWHDLKTLRVSQFIYIIDLRFKSLLCAHSIGFHAADPTINIQEYLSGETI